MKTLPLILKCIGLAVVVGSVLVIANCAQGQRGTVTIKKTGIILHPGTQISQADAKALNEVLKKYDKSLYRIDIYSKGEKKKSLGQLNDVYLDRTVVSEVAAWKESSEEATASLQVITTYTPTIPGGPSAPIPFLTPLPVPPSEAPSEGPPKTPSPGSAGEKAAKELIERLKPILEKYSKSTAIK